MRKPPPRCGVCLVILTEPPVRWVSTHGGITGLMCTGCIARARQVVAEARERQLHEAEAEAILRETVAFMDIDRHRLLNQERKRRRRLREAD